MARKNNGSENGKYKWLGHIQHFFNDAEIEACICWIEGRKPDSLGAIDIIAQQGIGIKFVYSSVQDGYHITLQPKDKHSYYYGYTLGLTHTDLERAIHISLYVVSELMEHQNIPLPETSTLPDW